MHKLNSRVEELINLCNFQLFASNVTKEIAAIKNCKIVGWQKG